MKLPIAKFLPKKEKSGDYLLTLLLRDEKATAVVVEQSMGKIQVIGQHQEFFSTSLEDIDEEELLDVLDRTISRAEETLPPDIETKKTVFGVKDDWVDEKKIKKEHLARLKKVSEALELQPIGFLVISEAVSRLIQEEEGAPPSAILAEIGTKSVNLILLRGGKVLDTKSGVIEESPMHTVDTLLKHFTVEVLPSRIIVFDGKRDHELIQKFITHQWSKSLPFLHVPQISVLPENFDARSIVFGAATQMGLEVLGEVVNKSSSEIKTFEHGEKAAVMKETPGDEAEQKEVKLPGTTEEGEKKATEVDEPQTDMPLQEGDNFGFVTEEDIEKIRPEKEVAHHASLHPQGTRQDNSEPDDESGEDDEVDTQPSASPLSSLMDKAAPLLSVITSLPKRIPVSPRSFSKVAGNKLVLLPLIALIALLGLYFLYTSQAKATITLHLKPKAVEQSQEVTFSQDSVNDFAKHTLQAQAVSSTLEGSVSTNSTGKKDVGDKAKGTVTLYNNNDAKKQISSGTTITSSNNLDFVLEKDVSIASASGDAFTGTKPGTAQVTVIAKNVGPEYNLPSNTKFTVAGAANVVAKNDSAFSGGSKKQVIVVAKKDQDKLLSDLPKSLTEKARTDLESKVEKDEGLLPDFIDTSISTKKFDKNVDDEAKTVTLKGKVTFEALTYKKKDLTDFATSLLKNEYSQDLRISDKGVTTELKNIESNDEEVTANISIKANLLPTLNADSIKEELKGKSMDKVEAYLTSLPQIATYDISLSPPIPFVPKFIPRTPDHITIQIKADE